MSAQDAIVRALGSPEAFPCGAAGTADVIQTHISYVFLAGSYAYKMKKDVKLAFLDFSTLDLRRHYCEEELRLNRLFAPGLYLDVLPIVPSGDTYRVGARGEGPAVDYVVHMRRFEAAQLLLDVFERGEFGEDDAVAIGRKLALLHGRARVYGPPDGFGDAAAVRHIIEENRQLTLDTVGSIQSQEEFDGYHAWALGYVETHGALIGRRLAEGRVRECHGDLHLKNLCVFGGEIQFFDRIEFNEVFKNIDVLYDLAFLYMDLRYRGAEHAANLLLNTYLERTGDYEGVLLMPLFASMRAYVRGMVASLLRKEEEVPEGAKRDAVGEAAAYFEHARGYGQPRAGRVIAMCGLSGSGKSTVAFQLAQRLEGVCIRSDALRKHLAGVSLDERAPEIYSEAHTEHTYDALANLGLDLAEHGFPIVLDATYHMARHRKGLRDRARTRGLALTFVMTLAPGDVMRERLLARKGDVSDATPEVLEAQRASFDPIGDDEAKDVRVVDTSTPVTTATFDHLGL